MYVFIIKIKDGSGIIFGESSIFFNNTRSRFIKQFFRFQVSLKMPLMLS